MNTQEFERYKQQIRLTEFKNEGQIALKRAKVLCVGAGGLGSAAATYLAAAGIGTIGIVDHDVVELSNLHRQTLYQTQQCGLYKVHAAEYQLEALNPNVKIFPVAEKLTTANIEQLIIPYDIVLDGLDNSESRYLLHTYCFKLNKPYIYASANQFSGYCALFSAPNGPCLECIFPSDENIYLNCSETGVIGTLPGLLGSLQATEAIKWILNIGTSLKNRLLVLDLLRMTLKDIQLVVNRKCRLCGSNELPIPIDIERYVIFKEDLAQAINKKKAILVDVRSPREHETQNIGGICIPLSDLPMRLDELDRRKAIILYCQTGQRSILALKILLNAGYKDVKYLNAGLVQYASENKNDNCF